MENKACVIIPLKEYNALKERIKELERDHPDIDIEWGYSHERYGYFYSNRGKLILSEGLHSQISGIKDYGLNLNILNNESITEKKRSYVHADS